MSRSSREGDDLSVRQKIDEGSTRVHPLSQMTWPAPRTVVLKGQRDRTLRDDLEPLLDEERVDAWSRLAERIDSGPGLSGSLHWDATAGMGCANPMVKPTPRLLFEFADLADGQATDFLRFARRYGPLDLCHHGKPATHVPPDVLDDLAEPYDVDTYASDWRNYEMTRALHNLGESELVAFASDVLHLEISDRDAPPPEPVEFPDALMSCRREPFADESLSIWAAYAREAGALIDILGDLAHSKPVPLDRWRPLAAHTGEPIEANLSDVPEPVGLDRLSEARQRQVKQKLSERRIALLNEQRPMIAWFVDRWIHLGGIRPRYTWGERGAVLDLVGPGGLFPALALQLADLLTDSRLAIVRCCECNRRYRPKRKLRPDQDNFCTRQTCQAARKRRYHRRLADKA